MGQVIILQGYERKGKEGEYLSKDKKIKAGKGRWHRGRRTEEGNMIRKGRRKAKKCGA